MSNDWTNKLRNQLADYQEPVSHDMWAEIEQSLAQSKKVGDEETDVKKRPQHQVQAGLLLLSVQKHNRQEVKMLSCLLKIMHLHIR